MLGNMRRRIRRWIDRNGDEQGEQEADVRIPEPPQPGGPERPGDAAQVRPPRTPDREKTHDGWSEIRRRAPGEDTDMGRDMLPDVTYPGRDLRPPEDDDRT
jgi:hypothetical protein